MTSENPQKAEEHCLIPHNTDSNKINQIINKLGFGRAQVLMGLGICFIAFADGAEITLITVASYILEDEWSLTTFELGILGGVILFGMSLGYLGSVLFEAKIGRLNLIKTSMIIILVFGVASGLMPEIWSLSAMRFAVGFGIALGTPPSYTVAAEICPTHMRGRFILLIEFFFGIGQLYVVCLAFLFTPELESENWRWVMILGTAPVVPAIGMLWMYGYESPLFLSADRQYELAVAVLNNMAQLNGKPSLNREEEDMVYSTMPAFIYNAQVRLYQLFDRWHLALSLNIIGLSTICTVAYYGLVLVLPFLIELDDASAGEILMNMVIIYCCQIPAVLTVIYLVEKELFGRKTTMVLGAAIVAVFNILCIFIDHGDTVYVFLLCSLSLTNAVFCVVFLYIPEVYPTEIRLLGLGVANIISRLSGSFSVYLLFFLIEQSSVAIFGFISALLVLLTILALVLPFDTRGTLLDSKIH